MTKPVIAVIVDLPLDERGRRKGFGFARVVGSSDKRDHFFHAAECHPPGVFDLLEIGIKVSVEPKLTPKGPRASNVRLADATALDFVEGDSVT